MKPLTKAGWYSVLVALIIGLVVFAHYHGFSDPAYALTRMIASAFWGGLTLGALFILLMAVLFLSA